MPHLRDMVLDTRRRACSTLQRISGCDGFLSGDGQTEQILNTANDAFIAMNTAGRITAWNKAAEALFGWTQAEAIGRLVSETVIPERFRAMHQQGLQRYLATHVPHVIGTMREVPAIHRDGHEFPVEITYWTLRTGKQESFYTFVKDITDRKRREEELERHAHYDPLTGLANRTLLMDRIQQLLARRKSDESGVAVLFIDLDRFKRVNDNLGHAAGDQVLVATAERLRQAVRPMDTVARLAGDEFIAVCPDVTTGRDAVVIADRIIAALEAPVRVEKDSIFLTASVGIALAEEDSNAESMINAADTAMYRAKSNGSSQYELFNTKMRMEAASRLRMESELHDAIEHGQLQLYFQPIISTATNTMLGAEALLRWQHPQLGLLAPGQFIPLAEETGMIVPIGVWVLEEACRCAPEWQKLCDGEAAPRVSINLSARQLAQSDLVKTVEDILAASRIDPARVQFGIEVTESLVMRDPEGAAEILREFRALGIHLSIDDFGTGYSSLAYLKRFPVDTLKVDRSFVADLPKSRVDRAIVRAVTDMAHVLGLTVVAEGVETEQQAEEARRANVDSIQGFLYAKPQPLEALIQQKAARLPNQAKRTLQAACPQPL